MRHACLPRLAALALSAASGIANAATAMAPPQLATYQVVTTVTARSDQRTRGMSDSLMQPALDLNVQVAQQSGLVAMVDLVTVSRKEFPGGDGVDLTLAGGYRFGDPDAWHFGLGLAAETFPGASFSAPHSFDLATGTPGNTSSTSYNSRFVVLEVGYGAIHGRVLDVISKTYRGADTGGVCGALLQYSADPTGALNCYARGDHGSRGTLLFDLGYKYPLNALTTLRLHAGYQRVANFPEADFADYDIGLTRLAWGLDWRVDLLATQIKSGSRALYLVQDGNNLRATDNNTVELSVSKQF